MITIKFCLQFELKKNFISIEYRKQFISFLKASLTSYKNGKYFDMYYHDHNTNLKPFCCGVIFPPAKFTKEIIELKDNFIKFFFSTYNYEVGINFYNALNNMKNVECPLGKDNSMILKKIIKVAEKNICENQIKVKFISPLCVRKHIKEGNKDIYFSFQSQEFQKMLYEIIKHQVRNGGFLDEKIVDGFYLEPLNPRKTVVKHYNQNIECSIGTFIMHGHPELLKFVYRGGIGSRTGASFGMFEVI